MVAGPVTRSPGSRYLVMPPALRRPGCCFSPGLTVCVAGCRSRLVRQGVERALGAVYPHLHQASPSGIAGHASLSAHPPQTYTCEVSVRRFMMRTNVDLPAPEPPRRLVDEPRYPERGSRNGLQGRAVFVSPKTEVTSAPDATAAMMANAMTVSALKPYPRRRRCTVLGRDLAAAPDPSWRKPVTHHPTSSAPTLLNRLAARCRRKYEKKIRTKAMTVRQKTCLGCKEGKRPFHAIRSHP